MTHLRALTTGPEQRSISEIVAARPRAFTYRELIALGSERRVRSAVIRGEVVRLLPNAYVAAVHADSFAARADAALLWAGPAAAVSGTAALFVWRLVEDLPGKVEIMLPHPTHLRAQPWLSVRRRVRMPATTRVDGLTVLAPTAALLAGYGRLPEHLRADALYRAVRSGLVTVEGIGVELRLTPRVPERRALERRVAAAAAGAESYLEEHGLTRVFANSDFSSMVRQHRIRTATGSVRLDMYDPESQVAIELDGARFHDGAQSRLRDIRRDAELARLGIQTVRLSYRDMVERPDWCRSTVLDVMAARRAQ